MTTAQRNLLILMGLLSVATTPTWAKGAYAAAYRPPHHTQPHQPAPPPIQPAKQTPPEKSATNMVQRPFVPYLPPTPKISPEKLEAEKKRIDANTVTWLKQRADEGSSSAQYSMGIRYLNGEGVEQNRELGRSLLLKSSDAGEERAKRKLEQLDSTPDK